MPKGDARYRDGRKLGRPHEVDGLERVDRRRFRPQKVALLTIRRSPMEEFIRQQNLALFKKRLAELHTDAEQEILIKLLADEEAKGPPPKIENLKPR
jgi:hypothetical protein